MPGLLSYQAEEELFNHSYLSNRLHLLFEHSDGHELKETDSTQIGEQRQRRRYQKRKKDCLGETVPDDG